MDTIGDLCNSMGITVEKLRKDVEPAMKVCVHTDICSHSLCEHKWPHHEHSEIGTCDTEPCVNMGVIAHCVLVTDTD